MVKISELTNYINPQNDDEFVIVDVGSNVTKKIIWQTIKDKLKNFFDTIYQTKNEIKLIGTKVINANYSLELSDAGKVIISDSTSSITISIPSNSSISFNIGTVIYFFQKNNGQIIFSPATEVSLYTSLGTKTRAQYSVAFLIKIASDEWVLGGDLTP